MGDFLDLSDREYTILDEDDKIIWNDQGEPVARQSISSFHVER